MRSNGTVPPCSPTECDVRACVQRQDAVSVSKRDECLDVAHDARETVPIGIAVVVARRVDRERHPHRRGNRRVAEVDHRPPAVHQVIDLGTEPWNRRRIEAGVQTHFRPARSSLGRQPLHAAAELAEPAGPSCDAGFDIPILQSIGRPVATARGGTEPEEPQRRQIAATGPHVAVNREEAVRPGEEQQAGVERLVSAGREPRIGGELREVTVVPGDIPAADHKARPRRHSAEHWAEAADPFREQPAREAPLLEELNPLLGSRDSAGLEPFGFGLSGASQELLTCLGWG